MVRKMVYTTRSACSLDIMGGYQNVMHRACVHVLKINTAGETIYLFVFALISARATFEF